MARHKMVLVDVDTQVDFMLPGGKLYVPGAERILPRLRSLREFAEKNGVPVVSSADAHPPDSAEFQQWPPHCVQGTPGQEKVPETLLEPRKVLPYDTVAVPNPEELSRCRQWILEKDALDLFRNVNAAELFEKLDAERYVVYGVVTEYCVKCAVFGLLERGRAVSVVRDAIQELDPEAGKAVLREMQDAGATLLETGEILRGALAA